MMESRNGEFEAILGNYEDADYAQFLERMRDGDSFEKMRARQRQLQDGSLPWTEEEDQVLKDRYHVFLDHPLCMELLAAELPEDSRRTAKGVKKRLAEIGLLQTRESRDRPAEPADAEASPSKKPRLAEDGPGDMDMEMPVFQDEDIEALEMDLEKLLDAEASRRVDDPLPQASGDAGVSSAAAANVADTALDLEEDTQPGMGLDLELELEAMIDESDSLPAANPQPAVEASLELELESLIDSDSMMQSSQLEPPASG